MSPGKFRGLQRLADASGLLEMVAIDQRNPIVKPIMAIRGLPEAPYQDVVDVKALLARHLAPHASAMLLDPVYSFPGTLPDIGAAPGLILAYENAATEETPGGLKSTPIPGWSVGKIRRAGADAAKVLVWYRADASAEVRAHQQAFVRAAGEACDAHDTIHLLEVLVYALPREDPGYLKTNRPRLVQEALRDFLDPSFRVDIYKVEPPTALVGVPDPDGPEAASVQPHYDAMAAMLDRPWVLLSAGAAAGDFQRALKYAYRAGASGYLCGRAIWSEAFKLFPDLKAMDRRLADEAVPYLRGINELTETLAIPWQKHRAFDGGVTVAQADQSFPKSYAA